MDYESEAIGAENDAREFERDCERINNEALAEAQHAQENGENIENIPTIFDIPDYNLKWVEEKIAKVNKRAARLGAEPITITDLGTWEQKLIATETMMVEGVRYFPGEVYRVVTMKKIQIVGKTPQLNGWTLVSVVEPTETGNMMRKFPGAGFEIPPEFRNVTPDRCDHCHTSRQRSETFIVCKGTEWKVVGRSCLKDFTGCGNPEGYARYAETLCDLMTAVGQATGIGEGSGHYECTAPLRSFLHDVAIETTRHGFITSKMASESNDDDYRQATGRKVFNSLYTPIHGNGPYEVKERAERRKYYESITDEEREDADETVDNAIQWGKEQFQSPDDATLTDYAHNMRVLLGKTYVRQKDVGFVASLISGYLRSIEKKIDYSRSKHVGKPGDKIAVPVTILKNRSWSGRFGTMQIVTMQDDEGNIYTLFAKEAQAVPEVGRYVTLIAKVKAHDSKYGISTTVWYAKFA